MELLTVALNEQRISLADVEKMLLRIIKNVIVVYNRY